MRHAYRQRAGCPALLVISTAISATIACFPAVAQAPLNGSSTAQVASPEPEPYCFGVGCPCGNDAPDSGCANSLGTGMVLGAFGSTSVSANDLQLYSYPALLNPWSPGQLIMSGTRASVPFGDGLLCVGTGATGLVRVDSTAISAVLGHSWGWVGIVEANEEILPGSTWYFQQWYRDPEGPCGKRSNFTNGLKVQFTP